MEIPIARLPGNRGPQRSVRDRIPWVTRPVEAPGVEFRTFESKAAKARVSFHVFTPERVAKDNEGRYPVLYWLHGTSGGLPGIAPLARLFGDKIGAGRIPPMRIVFPNGRFASMWCDSKDGKVPMETVVVKELVPHVDEAFRTVARREGRLVEGFSMGGYGAARLGLRFPDVFGAASILAGGPLDLELDGPRAIANPEGREEILEATFGGDMDYFRKQSPITIASRQAGKVRGKLLLRQAVGSRDFTADLNRKFSEHLKRLRIEHTFTEVPGVGHDTMALLTGLGDANETFYKQAFERAAELR
ncbi:MAG: alpha/beta hydrolase [Armatimonadota bacterium]